MWWLTHWGRVTHICVSKLAIIASDNGLSPGRRHAIIWTNDGIVLIWPLGTNFNEILSEIHSFSFMKIHLKMSSVKWRPFCLGLNVLNVDCVNHLIAPVPWSNPEELEWINIIYYVKTKESKTMQNLFYGRCTLNQKLLSGQWRIGVPYYYWDFYGHPINFDLHVWVFCD